MLGDRTRVDRVAQQHMDRLSSVDVSFLTNESASSHMHVGGILIFEGPPPSYDDLLEHIRGRLHLVPRFRQKLAHPPVQTGRPFWVDDPNFNLTYHVRHSALPAPGSEEQLRKMAARVFSQQLDRTKPLWELWLVQGLTRKRFALITKTHHALVDGVSGVDIATVLFDTKPVPEPAEPDHDWVPDPEPSGASLAAKGVAGAARRPAAPGAPLGAGDPAPAARPLRQLAEAVEGVGEIGWAFANPAPKVPLNVDIGSHRRFVWVRSDLAQMKRVKDALGGTVNDVVLAVVAGGVRDWLHARGIRTEGLELRAQVPVSIRAEDERGQLGNRLAAMRAPLPVYIADPVRRLHAVTRAMQGLKQSKQALGAEVITRFNDFAPANPSRAGRADQLLDPSLQPGGHQRAGPADPALRARPRAGGHLPRRLPAAPSGSVRGHHELQRRHQLRPARGLRLDRRRRGDRRGHRAIDRRAGQTPRRRPRRSPSPRRRPAEPGA